MPGNLNLRKFILVSGDIFLLYLSLFLTLSLRYAGRFSQKIFQEHFLAFSFLYIAWLAIFYIFDLYNLFSIKPKIDFLKKVGESLLVCLGVGIIFFYLVPAFRITPKTNLTLDVIIFGFIFIIWRRSFYLLFSSQFLRNLAILGKIPLSQKLARAIKNQPQLGYKFVGFLSPKKNIVSQLKREKVNSLIVAKNLSASPQITKKLYQCLPLKINFMDLAQAYEMILYKIPIDFVSQIWFLENLSEGEKRIYDKLKRWGDIILAILIIILTSPLWLIFAYLIKREDKGPVFYRQQRVGRDGKLFWLWKFRSMSQDAEKGKPIWAKKDDPRITKIGKFMRNTHLDELPQMISILKGDISLVGPRPERPRFVKKLEKMVPHYRLRHIIKPGFTGWAQVKFRYARTLEDSHEKFQYDLYYIKNRSFFLDFGILLKTFQLFFRRG